MDWEKALLAKSLREKKFSDLLAAKIEPSWFASDGPSRPVFQWMQQHFLQFNDAPGTDALAANFPTYKLPETPETLAFYIGALRTDRADWLTQGYLAEIEDLASEEKWGSVRQRLIQAGRDMAAAVDETTDVDLTDAYQPRLDRYDYWFENPRYMRGTATGFDFLDRVTRGWRRGWLVYLIGLQKAGKSAVMLHMARAANEANKTVLMVSVEIGQEEMEARYDASLAGMNYQDLLSGDITLAQRREMVRRMRRGYEGHSFWLVSDTSSSLTVPGLSAKIAEKNPDVVFFDGAYFLEDYRGENRGSPAAMTNISRDLHLLTMSTGVPIIASWQALEAKTKRGALTAGSGGYTSAIGQDCNVLVGVNKRDDPLNTSTKYTVDLSVLLNRSGPTAGTVAEIDWGRSCVSELGNGWGEEEDNMPAAGF